jgi:hypothetical protein
MECAKGALILILFGTATTGAGVLLVLASAETNPRSFISRAAAAFCLFLSLSRSLFSFFLSLLVFSSVSTD